VAARETIEREVKLEAEPGFALPKLRGEARPQRTFESVYFDSSDGRLRCAGMTLRRRIEKGAGVWQLKLPRKDARLELELEGGDDPPPELVAALGSVLRGAELQAVVSMRTRRAPFAVARNGTELAEVALDEVEVLAAGEPQGFFSELEVELKDGDERDLRRIVKRLREAGARDATQATKLDRALGGAPGQPATELGRAIAAQVRTLLAHEVGLRLAPEDEDVHQLRVAMRRLRAYLRAARPLLDESWSEPLRDELREVGRTLGDARDLDVLIAHVDRALAELDEPGGAALVAELRAQREALQPSLLESLSGARWHELLDRLDQEPPVHEGPGFGKLAKAEGKRLRKREVDADASDEELHALRRRIKRARYAAELAGADEVVERAKVAQDVLGEHQDAVVAEERLRALARAKSALAAGRLVELERARRRGARGEYPRVWKRLRRAL
jgi:CHAD domain-containing protein